MNVAGLGPVRSSRELEDRRVERQSERRQPGDRDAARVAHPLVAAGERTLAFPREVLDGVLTRSQLRETFGVNALALVAERVNGDTIVRPQRLSLHDMLVYFIDHRLTVIVRRSRYELAKRAARLHIVQGLLKALDVIDEVIDTIRRSRTAATAEQNLRKKFGFSQLQAQAILAMQLRRLAALALELAGRYLKRILGLALPAFLTLLTLLTASGRLWQTLLVNRTSWKVMLWSEMGTNFQWSFVEEFLLNPTMKTTK